MRPLPWTDIVAAIGEEHFKDYPKTLDRDAFLLHGTVAATLREMMPEDAPTEALNAYGTLLYMMYQVWARDYPTVATTKEQVQEAVAGGAASSSSNITTVCYVQLPERLVWAEPGPGEPHEPLDGIFLVAQPGRADALAVLGLRAEREGFTTMEGAITLPAPAPSSREDSSAPFAPRMPGGESAGLLSVVDEHELVTLALRLAS